MRIVKSLSLLGGIGALALSASFVVADDSTVPSTAAPQAQTQPRTTARTTNTRRTYRSYSYEPSRGGDIGARVPTWSRADSKVKFRYGTYPY